MVRQLILLFIFLIIGVNLINAQEDIECKTKLSLFHEPVKAKKYDTAYADWLFVKTNCPELNIAIYSDGEKILKHKIKNTKGDEKLGHLKGLIDLWKARNQYFSKRTPNGEYAAKACQLQYDNKELFGKSKEELYNCYDDAFKEDAKTFTHPKSLYSYFSLMVYLFDEGKKTDAELFNGYDDITEKTQDEVQIYSEKLNPLLEKLERDEVLTQKENKNKSVYESYLKNYALIQENINTKVDIRAICDNLIPLYSKDFETYQNDSIWLKRSVTRMYHKQCTDDPLYEKLVKRYDKVAPSYDTKIFVATMLLARGKDKEAYQYLEEAYLLFDASPYKKSKLAFRIGVILKNKNQYSKSRRLLLDAVKLNPSNGKPHILIAEMYGKSAKNCGKDNVYQRAVFWLASEEVKKASKIDPTLHKFVNQYVASYESKAPTKEEIFLRDLAGKTIKIGCWINRSILVPKP
ncbi:tetratricopeptide repeat protein [Winogradskyella sp. PG-2]|uniref:tetratricopeptide repeat protein n=1 Tax=Winogradskyella sp. PG-2 TaxID=754409 RepID=UPI0004588238|nr:tetratricopeptide repeat protein [Winogradskyella sp. PG-2]BAO75273.1 hypothetical protein WPG_1043 [Winogradskyella sp. PG-2]